MKIRIINENDWEKSYDLDKSIIRVGSQISCDVQIRDNNVQPFLMQIVRSGSVDFHYDMLFFAENIMITRGNQVFPASTMVPYDVLDGDKISFSKYRMIINLEDEWTRIRTSMHMKATLFLSRRELSLEAPINGVLQLNNLGTDKPCQFRMRIDGIPAECLQAAPLPYIYPGGSSSVGFVISHLRTRPGPGFHTVSITISAPDEYFGEALEFNQDIYVNPVFENEIILEDDSNRLTGFNKKLQISLKEQDNKTEPVIAAPTITDARRLDASADLIEEQRPNSQPILVTGSDDSKVNPFEEPEEEVSEPYARKKLRDSVVVIRHNENDAFDNENGTADQDIEEIQTVRRRTKRTKKESPDQNVQPDENVKETDHNISSEPISPEPAEEPKKTEKKKGRQKSGRIPKNVPVISDRNSLFEGETADEKEQKPVGLTWNDILSAGRSEESAAEAQTETAVSPEKQTAGEVSVPEMPDQPELETHSGQVSILQIGPETAVSDSSEKTSAEKQPETEAAGPDDSAPAGTAERAETETSAAEGFEQNTEEKQTEPEISLTAGVGSSMPEAYAPVETPAAAAEADETPETNPILTIAAEEPQPEPALPVEKAEASDPAGSAVPEADETPETNPILTIAAEEPLPEPVIPEEKTEASDPAGSAAPEADETPGTNPILTIAAEEPQPEPVLPEEKPETSVSDGPSAPEISAAELPVPAEQSAQPERKSETEESAAAPHADGSKKPGRQKNKEKKQDNKAQKAEQPASEEPQFLNVKGMDGSYAIPVITSSNSFDDSADAEPDSRSSGSTEKPEIRVVKGGSFDE